MPLSGSVILPFHVTEMHMNLKHLPNDGTQIMIFKHQHTQTTHNTLTGGHYRTNPHKKSNTEVQWTMRTI